MPDETQRQLTVFHAGPLLFGVFADQAEGATEWRKPARLPHAPPSILGVVRARGRMLTVIDPLALVGSARAADGVLPACIIPLKGEEQLGLAIDKIDGTIEVSAEDYSLPGDNSPVVRGITSYDGEQVLLLDVKEIFSAAMKGAERRRRRF